MQDPVAAYSLQLRHYNVAVLIFLHLTSFAFSICLGTRGNISCCAVRTSSNSPGEMECKNHSLKNGLKDVSMKKVYRLDRLCMAVAPGIRQG